MSKNLRIQIATFLMWAINVKIFLILANRTELWQIYKYSSSLFAFYRQTFQFYLEFVTTIPLFTIILSIVFAILLYAFWFYYFEVYFKKLPKVSSENTGWWGVFASVFTFLGFGCVACGETLLTSILIFFAGSTTAFSAHLVGNLSIILGILILGWGVYKNYKILHNKNICAI